MGVIDAEKGAAARVEELEVCPTSILACCLCSCADGKCGLGGSVDLSVRRMCWQALLDVARHEKGKAEKQVKAEQKKRSLTRREMTELASAVAGSTERGKWALQWVKQGVTAVDAWLGGLRVKDTNSGVWSQGLAATKSTIQYMKMVLANGSEAMEQLQVDVDRARAACGQPVLSGAEPQRPKQVRIQDGSEEAMNELIQEAEQQLEKHKAEKLQRQKEQKVCRVSWVGGGLMATVTMSECASESQTFMMCDDVWVLCQEAAAAAGIPALKIPTTHHATPREYHTPREAKPSYRDAESEPSSRTVPAPGSTRSNRSKDKEGREARMLPSDPKSKRPNALPPPVSENRYSAPSARKER